MRLGAPLKPHPTAYGWTAASVALVTALGTLLYSYIDQSDIIMLYLAVIMMTAARFGRGPSTLASVPSVAAFDFCFVPPFFARQQHTVFLSIAGVFANRCAGRRT